ncbi:hypothetical protein [Bradyrhizobium sp. WSM471]|uniref:hypothetical protein n=1 Tax=Bradyrhizobium sp. WSM471 TaxID=319017 RepID=UPI00024D201A|nr:MULTISPECIES: hypothetical protein [Bradyrhizobium]EHR01239.1 hypothetical protein Bra471DRAFT_01941 [Bradyrhizobium sp. WSM471]UFW43303.1 hypothetical protein BcanWSM471_09555 [Bradyrhizobium canariense]
MQKFLIAVLTILSVALSASLGVVLHEPQVSTIEIDRDRAALYSQISTTQEESEKYGPGILKGLIELRLAISRNTLAMLDQKRTSFVRRIALDYRLDGRPVHDASDQELGMILEELSQAEKKAAASKLEAARYSGGLIHVMSLLKAETDELSVSQLRLKFYSAKHGIPMPLPDLTDNATKPTQPPGKVVKDRDAL